MGTNKSWDDNLRAVLLALFKLVREFKVVTSIVVLGVAITLGWFDVGVFEAVVDGLVKLAVAAIPGIGE